MRDAVDVIGEAGSAGALVIGAHEDAATIVDVLGASRIELVLLLRGEDAQVRSSGALAQLVTTRFGQSPGLSALALAPSEVPFAATMPVLGPHLPETRLWPAALAVRVPDLLAVARELPGDADPLLGIAERLESAGAAIEWRAYTLASRPRPAGVYANVRPRLDPAPIPPISRPAVPPAPDRYYDGWVCIERLANVSGGRRVVRAGTALGPGEFRERSLCLVRAEPFPDHVELLATTDGRGDHPVTMGPQAVSLGHLHRTGLPGGVHLSVFHDPERGDDFVGLTDEHVPGCHLSRSLGWALAFPSALAPLPSRLPVDRVRLRHHRGSWSSVPATAGDPAGGDAGCVALLHREWAPDRIPLFRRVDAGRERLTVDPFSSRPSGLRELGFASRRERPGLARLSISPAGDPTLTRGTDAAPVPGEAPPIFVEASPMGTASHRRGVNVESPRPSLRGRIGTLRRRRRRGDGHMLIVAPWFSVGGGDNFLLSLIKLQRSRGVPVSAVLTFHRDASPVDNRAAFTPHLDHLLCPPESRPGTPIETAVAEAIRDLDVTQLFLCGAPQLYPHLPALKASFPWVRIIDQLFNDVGHLGQNTAQSAAIDLTICAYRGLKDLLVEGQGRDPSRVALAYIGIDTRTFHPGSAAERRAAKKALGLDPDREVWGYLGRISEEKCLHNFVEAVARLDGCCDAQFLIQGGGPGREDIETFASKRAPAIAVRPFADDVGRALQALDVYVLPSRTEGIPLGVMEAMASGVLPVATSVGGLPEVITPGVTGYLVAPGDPGAIAVGMLAAARTAPAVREEMAQVARSRIVAEMSLRAMNDRYLEILS